MSKTAEEIAKNTTLIATIRSEFPKNTAIDLEKELYRLMEEYAQQVTQYSHLTDKKIEIEHYADGFGEYDLEIFGKCQDDLYKIVTDLLNDGIIPQLHTRFNPNNEIGEIYYLVEIIYYNDSIRFYFDDIIDRNIYEDLNKGE
jgi:hypothetical protein